MENSMNKIIEALGMKKDFDTIKDLIGEKKEGINEEIEQVIEERKIPEVVVVLGRASRNRIEKAVRVQNKYYEKKGLYKRQIPVYLDDSANDQLINAMGIFCDQGRPFWGVSERYYPVEFILEYLVKPIQEESFKKENPGFVVLVGKIPLSTRTEGIVNILGAGLHHKGAMVSTYPFTTGKKGFFSKLGIGFDSSLQKAMNHVLGNVHGLGNEGGSSVMSSSAKEKTYREKHLDKIKEDIALLTGHPAYNHDHLKKI